MKIAIIGAGMAGLTCADRLGDEGYAVTLFEKSRGAGGRMATRRISTPDGDAAFDHGCQYFTASSDAFQAQVKAWADLGLIARWPDAGTSAWVGVPGMNAIPRHIASRHDVILNCHARMLNRRDGQWFILSDGRIDGPFDIAIITTPPEQAAPMLSLHDFAMARIAASVASVPCWTLMLAFAAPLDAGATHRNTGIIGWAARNNSKPGRGPAECWVVQATPAWSAQHIDTPPAEVEAKLLEALMEICSPLPPVSGTSIHRWRYAHADGTNKDFLWNPDIGLGACGDWLSGNRVENAWASGHAMADAITSSLAGYGQRGIASHG